MHARLTLNRIDRQVCVRLRPSRTFAALAMKLDLSQRLNNSHVGVSASLVNLTACGNIAPEELLL